MLGGFFMLIFFNFYGLDLQMEVINIFHKCGDLVTFWS